MVLAAWNCFTIPFFVAFEPEVADHIGVTVMDGVIDLLFLMDIILNFRTTYIDPNTGNEV